ncbi:hypothetical protein HMPREF9710_04297, partial [Massilia timonae CCUG 45783]
MPGREAAGAGQRRQAVRARHVQQAAAGRAEPQAAGAVEHEAGCGRIERRRAGRQPILVQHHAVHPAAPALGQPQRAIGRLRDLAHAIEPQAGVGEAPGALAQVMELAFAGNPQHAVAVDEHGAGAGLVDTLVAADAPPGAV